MVLEGLVGVQSVTGERLRQATFWPLLGRGEGDGEILLSWLFDVFSVGLTCCGCEG